MDSNRVVDSEVKESVVVFAPVVESKETFLKRVDNHVAGLSREGASGS